MKKLRHPWLDANDPANTKRIYMRGGLPGFWVPTPDEIEYQCELIREASAKTTKRSLGGVDERRFERPPKQVTLFANRKTIDDAPQLCDCPYWGTEFTTNRS